MALCVTCEERGRKQEAHRVVDGTPMCQWCFAGKQHPADHARDRELAKAREGHLKLEMEEKCMNCEYCGKEVRAPNTGPLCFKCGLKARAAKQPSDGGGGGTRREARKTRGKGAANGTGGVMIAATPELLNAVWASLPLEKQAALLNKLPEV